MRFRIADAVAGLPLPADERWTEGVWDRTVWSSGPAELLAFAPRGADHQQPHDRDELYVVVTGTAVCTVAGEALDVGPGDAVVVPARVEHRFSEMSEDFATWVLFWGRPGN